MKTNQEILDEFGGIIINDIYDDSIKHFNQLIENKTKWETGRIFSIFFNKLSIEDREILKTYLEESIKTSIFGFLGVFEEHERFKLIYEEDGKQVNLVEISEMLKAEPLGENGWIERFSKYSKEKELYFSEWNFKKIRKAFIKTFLILYPEPESNRHALRRWILSLKCVFV